MKTTMQSDSPDSAQRDEPEQKVSRQNGPAFWKQTKGFSGRIWAVAWCEILLQTRSIVSWVMLAAFTLLTVLNARSQVSTAGIYISNGQVAVTICSYAASFILFLLPFLHANTFARDRQRKMHQLVWTRSLASLEYALGKGLGAVGISLLLSWLPLVAGWLTASIVRGEMQPLDLWLPMLLIVGAGTILVVLCALFCIALTTPIGLLGALIPAALVVYIDVIFAKSMLFLNNLTATTLFTSPSIGFGPDGSLLLWQRLSYVLGGVFFLSLLALVYQLRERLGVVQIRHVVSTALLIILAGGMLFASVSTFQNKGASYTDSGLMTAKPMQATTSNYKLDVSANPASGEVQGSASFTLTPQGNAGTEFVIELNPGLHVRQVEGQKLTGDKAQALSFRETSPGWTDIRLASSQPLGLTITYSGQMIFGRDDYRAATGGYGRENGISWSGNYFYLSYLGQSVGELLGAAGSWYPLPFTQQALDAGTRVPVDELRLRFPTSFKVWTSLGSFARAADGNWQELDAQPHAGLPVALAAALSSAQQGSVDGLSFWYQGNAPEQTQLLTYRLAMQEAQALNTWLAPGSVSTALQTVVVPMLPFPVIGPGLLLVPETLGANGLDPLNGSPYTPTVIARYIAGQLAQSWWLNTAFFPFTSLTGDSSTQNPAPSTSIAPTNALLNMLSEYSAVVITDKVISSNFFADEMQVCSQAYALPPNTYSQQEQALQQKMTALGTTCVFSELVPFRLQLMPKIGFTGLTNFLQQYASTHTQQKTDMRQFLQQASALAGKDIIPEAGPYICPDNGKGAQSSASDPLACLNGMYSGT